MQWEAELLQIQKLFFKKKQNQNIPTGSLWWVTKATSWLCQRVSFLIAVIKIKDLLGI